MIKLKSLLLELHEIIVGIITTDDEVFAHKDAIDHGDVWMKMRHITSGKTVKNKWRYNKENKTVYWWEDWSKNDAELVSDYIKYKYGFDVINHLWINGENYKQRYLKSHGLIKEFTKGDPLTFTHDCRDHYRGQNYCMLHAKDKEGNVVGRIVYSTYQSNVYIDTITVEESERRKGIATSMANEMKREFSNWKIDWGYTTELGTNFVQSLKEEFTNHFRGWISPDGREFNSDDGGTHSSHAHRLLQKFYPNWKWESLRTFQQSGVIYADLALEYKGWIRVVDNGIYSIYKMTPQIKSILIELLSELPNNYPVKMDIEDGRSIGGRSTAREVLNLLNDEY